MKVAVTEPVSYEIRVRAVLDEKRVAYLSPLTLEYTSNETIIRGGVYDQAELLGILLKIRDLRVQLIAVTPI